MTEYTKGDYTSCYASICEIWSKTDDGDEELYATVRLEDADKIIDVLNENEQLKKGKWQCRLCGFTGTIEHICRKKGDVE